VTAVRAAAIALMAALALGPTHAGGASLVLSDSAREQAVTLGTRSVTSEVFGAEWRVENRTGESATVMTPFHRIALAARHAAFRGEPLKAADQERLLGEQRGRLLLLVELWGPREDFARFLVPELRVDGAAVKAAFVQNERTAAREGNGRYRARCVYAFPVKELTGTSRLGLVVRDADGREVSVFGIDLGAMR
jgi:hypothetical protein